MASKAKTTGPDLKQYLDKKLSLKLNGNRVVVGVLLVRANNQEKLIMRALHVHACRSPTMQ